MKDLVEQVVTNNPDKTRKEITTLLFTEHQADFIRLLFEGQPTNLDLNAIYETHAQSKGKVYNALTNSRKVIKCSGSGESATYRIIVGDASSAASSPAAVTPSAAFVREVQPSIHRPTTAPSAQDGPMDPVISNVDVVSRLKEISEGKCLLNASFEPYLEQDHVVESLLPVHLYCRSPPLSRQKGQEGC